MTPKIKILYCFNDDSMVRMLSINFIISIIIKIIAYVNQADWTFIKYNGFANNYEVVDRDSKEPVNTPLAEWVKNGCSDVVCERCNTMSEYLEKTKYIKERTGLMYYDGKEEKGDFSFSFFITEPSAEMDSTI